MGAYTKLLIEAQPQAIETSEQYDAAMSRVDALIRKGKSRTPDETKLFRLLLEVSEKTPADLLPIFGQGSHVNEALKGKRTINLTHARKPGEMFRLDPGYFV